MTVLVVIPYFGTPEYVERAVRSVLAQTHEDIVCVVIGDGDEPPLGHIRDERLVVQSYPVNRGVYFAQDVAIWASPFEWYAIVASDDWVDPDHIEQLLLYDRDMACGALWAHGDGEAYCGPANGGHASCRGTLVRKAYEVGIYRTETYRRIGAHNPMERIGQDSLTLAVMRLVGDVGGTRVPTYNRRFRAGSLCTSPETANGSPARTAMRIRNREVYAKCKRLGTAEAIRTYRQSLISAEVSDALEAEVDRLRSRLGQPAEVAA